MGGNSVSKITLPYSAGAAMALGAVALVAVGSAAAAVGSALDPEIVLSGMPELGTDLCHESCEASALSTAIYNDDVAGVTKLMKVSADMSEDMTSVVHYVMLLAVRMGRVKIVQLLLDEGADVNAPDNHPPLFQAAKYGHLRTAAYLVARGAATTFDGNSVAHQAAVYGHTHMVRWFGRARFADLAAKNSIGYTVAHCAAIRGDVDMLKRLPNRFLFEKTGDNDETLLHLAARAGKLPVLKYLNAAGMTQAHLRTPNSSGCLPVHLAVKNQEEAACLYLIELMGADEANAQGETTLSIAIRYHESGFVETLLDMLMAMGASLEDLSKYATKEGLSYLDLAACGIYKISPQVFRLIFDKFPLLRAGKGDGTTFLHQAAKHTRIRPPLALDALKDGEYQKYNTADNAGNLPIHAAEVRVVFNYLYDRQKNPDDIINAEGMTLAMVNAANGNSSADILRKLEAAGTVQAALIATDYDGRNLSSHIANPKVFDYRLNRGKEIERICLIAGESLLVATLPLVVDCLHLQYLVKKWGIKLVMYLAMIDELKMVKGPCIGEETKYCALKSCKKCLGTSGHSCVCVGRKCLPGFDGFKIVEGAEVAEIIEDAEAAKIAKIAKIAKVAEATKLIDAAEVAKLIRGDR
jgi:ankyrin repeat protein